MTTYAYPTLTRAPHRSTYGYVGNSTQHRSWLTGFVQTVSFGGEAWKASLFYESLQNADRTALLAFVAKLNGQQHRVSLPVFGKTNQGAFGGTPLVDGAGQTGNTLTIDGASTSVTGWIKAGDYFSVNGELKMAIADANSDGSGDVTLTFRPRLRSSPANNAAIETTTPVGTFILADDTVDWSYNPNDFTDVALSFVEALS